MKERKKSECVSVYCHFAHFGQTSSDDILWWNDATSLYYCTLYVSSSLFLVQSSVGIKAQVQIIESS